MKERVKIILKDKGEPLIFSDDRYNSIKELMEFGMKKDKWLNNYLSLDSENKAEWIADHLIMFVKHGSI